MFHWRTTHPRSALIVVLLLSTLALSALLALEAVTAARYHRVTAERVLSDYTEAAAQEYAQRVARDLEYYGSYPVFGLLQRHGVNRSGSTLPAASDLNRGATEYERRAVGAVKDLFRVHMEDGGARLEATAGADSLRGWLIDTLPAHARAVFDPEWRSAALLQPGRPRHLVFYTVERSGDGTPRVAYGFEMDLDSLRALLQSLAHRAPLLPPSLLRGIEPDSVMAVELVDATGAALYRSGSWADASGKFLAHASAGPRYGGLTARVALRPEAAARLIIGGIPQTRLPLVLGLLLLAAGLIGAALLQFRREQEFARLRTEFVSNVSHELRTPLSQIRMFAETLLLGRVRSSDEQRRSLEIIDQEARRLTHLVDNVLQFSRAERRVSRVAREPTPLAPLVREAIELFTPVTESQRIRFHTDLDQEVEADVDRGAVRQMLVNLLDNAVKYGPSGQTVTVGLRLQGATVRFWVDDQGPGIPEADRALVWERFARLERERASAVAGTGIGLAVVRDLAEQQGGRAWTEAAPGGGARFLIQLPHARRIDAAGVPAVPEPATRPAGPPAPRLGARAGE